MKITRKSPFTGKIHTMNLPILPQQLEAWQAGKLAQNAFPNLNADQREFIMTGIIKEEWDQFIGNGE